MKDFKASKVVFKLPEKLEPNTSYWVRSGGGFDLYLSDVTGSVAYKPNVTSSQLADTLPIGKGGTGATDAASARDNLGLGTAATKSVTTTAYDTAVNKVLKTGDFGIGGKAPIFASMARIQHNTTENATLFSTVHSNNGGAFYSNTSFNINGRYTPQSFNYLVSGVSYRGLFVIGGDVINGDFFIISGSPDIGYPLKLSMIYHDVNTPKLTGTWAALKSGQASYKKGWRKLTAILPSQEGEITKAHGVTTVETVQAKVTNSDGIIIYNNDIDPTNQFYVRVNGANLILGVTANSTKVFGKAVTIYVGEEL